MTVERVKSPKLGCLLHVFMMIFVLTVVLIFMAAFGLPDWPIQALFHLVAGPFIHAWKNLPSFLQQWPQAVFPVICLALACVLGHRFIRWWVTATGDKVRWRLGHTLAATALLLLGSAAAIALSGVAHQAAWLMRTQWTEIGRGNRARITHAMSNARQCMMLITEYEMKHGRYPESLGEAALEFDYPQNILWAPASRDMEPFVLLEPGGKSGDTIRPILLSPVIQPDGVVVVGYSDCTARQFKVEEWEKIRLGQ